MGVAKLLALHACNAWYVVWTYVENKLRFINSPLKINSVFANYSNPTLTTRSDAVSDLRLFFLDRMKLMSDSESSGDAYKYWVYGEWCLMIASTKLDEEDKEIINRNYQELERKVLEIKLDPKLNDLSKTNEENKHRALYIRTHLPYIFSAFSRLGFITNEINCEVDFQKTELELLHKVVSSYQSDRGSFSSMTSSIGHTPEKPKEEEKPVEKPADLSGIKSIFKTLNEKKAQISSEAEVEADQNEIQVLNDGSEFDGNNNL